MAVKCLTDVSWSLTRGNNLGEVICVPKSLRKWRKTVTTVKEIACIQVSCSRRKAHEYISFTREEVVRHTTIHDKNISYVLYSYYIHTYLRQCIQILNYHCFLSGSALVFPPSTSSQSSSDHTRLYLPVSFIYVLYVVWL